jgi:threonine/homoserine/homoserine lactone efflux protein
LSSILLSGLLLGWSVAWPPGPINAEMIRRMLMPASAGGGFWSAWSVGLGACTGDFTWALAVTAGAGAFLNQSGVRLTLGVVSFFLLLILASIFARSAWKSARSLKSPESQTASGTDELPARRRNRSYLLGLTFALTSPWNIGFWLAVIGGQRTLVQDPSLANSLVLASSVVLGAIAWGIVLCTCLRLGARFFARPEWQIGTQVLSAMVMLWFAARLALQLLHAD